MNHARLSHWVADDINYPPFPRYGPHHLLTIGRSRFEE